MLSVKESLCTSIPLFKVKICERTSSSRLGWSFAEFKQALKEYSVLNGREIMFVKNDDIRVKVVCKKKCGFLILCSKVILSGSRHWRWFLSLLLDDIGDVQSNRWVFISNQQKVYFMYPIKMCYFPALFWHSCDNINCLFASIRD